MKWFARLAIFFYGLAVILINGVNVVAGKQVFSEKKCQAPPRSVWSKPETWVWERICEGGTADLRDYVGELEEKGFSKESFILGAGFLRTILVNEPYKSALTRKGVQITNAWFADKIDLSATHIHHDLVLTRSILERGANLSRMTADRLVAVIESTVQGPMEMDSMEIRGSLFMRKSKFADEIDLTGTVVEHQLSLSGSTVKKILTMDALNVGGSLIMNQAEFGDVILRGAKIGEQLSIYKSKLSGLLNMDDLASQGSVLMRESTFEGEVIFGLANIGGEVEIIGCQFFETSRDGRLSLGRLLSMNALHVQGSLHIIRSSFNGDVSLEGAEIGDNLKLDGSRFDGRLDMDGIRVDGDVSMQVSTWPGEQEKAPEFRTVSLAGAKIGGQLTFLGAQFAGQLNLDTLQVGRSVFMRDAEFNERVDLVFARIGSNLDISGATITWLDLTSTQIGAELRLASKFHDKVDWTDDARFILRNTVTYTVQDRTDSWPQGPNQSLELDGFVYQRLGGFLGEGAESDMATRGIDWFIGWLAHDRTYSPQPYAQLAGVLIEAGRATDASEILFAARERERQQAARNRVWSAWMWQSLYLVFIGHGHRIYYAIYWSIGFLLMGMCVLWVSGQGRKNKMPWGFSYSLDLFLPVIKLRDYHYREVDLDSWPRYYFYFHQIMGYVLASFLIAGLAELIE